MSRFDEAADRVLDAASNGANLRESCNLVEIPYATVRSWISAGRRDPNGTYADFARRLDAARAGRAAARPDDDDAVHDRAQSTPGPVEARVDALVSGRELNRQVALATETARALARKIDQLDQSPGAAAAQAMALCTRRLSEIIPELEAPREDELDKLKAKFHARRSSMKAGYGWTSHAEAEEHAASNGKVDGEVGVERGAEW